MLAACLAAAALLTAGCGKVEADRDAIAQNLGLAYGAYLTYVAEPAQAGKLGPATSRTDPVEARALDGARYAVRAVEAARAEAAPDEQLASFAQKTAAAGASLNAISQVLETGRPSKSLVAGGTASLESLLASARDLGFTVDRRTVREADLANPPSS